MTILEAYQGAKKILLTKGWGQKFFFIDKDGCNSGGGPGTVCYCLAGALQIALGGTPDAGHRYTECLNHFEEKYAENLITWNDALGRTKEQVIERIEEIERDFQTSPLTA